MKADSNNHTKIKVIGVGGGGNNAVNRMIASGLEEVDFWAVNTDIQALHGSLSENILQIGTEITKGLGSGSNPEMGMRAAEESIEEVKRIIEGADMIFITAGMGGGTGTGASTIIAKAAKQAGALTVGVVTKPFKFEGPIRMKQADEGIIALKEEVDALIVIPNDKLLQVIEQTTSLKEAFMVADDVLLQGVQGITKIISRLGLMNLDFADVKTIMKDAGSAIMGIGKSTGSQRAIEAAEAAINNPLLEESITGATGVIFNIASGENLSLYEVNEAAQVIYESIDPNAHIIVGTMIDESLKDEVVVTVIATGFKPGVRKEPIIPDVRNTKSAFSYQERENSREIKPVKPLIKSSFEEPELIIPKIDVIEKKEQHNFETEANNAVEDFDEDDISIPTFLRKRK